MRLVPSARDLDTDASIDRPIFVFGVPRSGTTVTLALMASHPDLAWSSQFTNLFPAHPELAILSRVLDMEIFRQHLPTESMFVPKPSEPYRLLNYVTDGLFTQPRPLEGAEVTLAASKRYRRAVRRHLHWQGKSRYLQKHTGFPRTKYLRAIFPDAKFIHVLRDGRAVANSLRNVWFFGGTMGSWRWGPMRPEFEEEYRRSGQSPMVLAAIWWKTLVDLLEPALSELPSGQGLTVRYDRLIADPSATMVDLAEFCGLEASPLFERRVKRVPVNGSDDKWKELPSRERRLLEASLGGYLERLGFA